MRTELIALCFAVFPSVGFAAQSVDQHGHPFRTEFSLHDRALGSVGWDDQGKPLVALELRLEDDVPFTDEQIWWRLQTRLFSTSFSDGRVEGVLAAGSYLRHDVSSHIVIPSDPDILLPAPFDVYLEWALGGVVLDRDEVRSVAPISGVVGADFCRDATYRTRCAIGPILRYRYDLVTATHELVPFSQIEARVLSERRDGRLSGGLVAMAGWSTSGNEHGWEPELSVTAQGEWLIFAVNDQPVSLFIDGEYDRGLALQMGVRASFGGR